MSNNKDISYSPDPLPPTTLSPGIRAGALQKIFNDALDHTLRICSYDNFAACFPTPAKYVPDSLDGLHRDFISRLGEVCKHEFAALLDERTVITNLNELDSLIAEARKKKQFAEDSTKADQQGSFRPLAGNMPQNSVAALSLLTAHTAPFISDQAEDLDTRIIRLQKSNIDIYEDIQTQRFEIEVLVRKLEGLISDINGANQELEVRMGSAQHLETKCMLDQGSLLKYQA